MKKVVVAVDSFKGCLTSMEVADAVEYAVRSHCPQCEVVKCPVADGGEGTVEALVWAMKGRLSEVIVNDPLMRPVKASYGIVSKNIAVIEMAAASGLPLLKKEERNPLLTTSYGTGELIKNAITNGCREFVIGIGGSATNDAGTGMLEALGYRFYDTDGNQLSACGGVLGRIASIDSTGAIAELSHCRFKVACDVTNPFSGKNGAAYIFAPQKGATPAMVRQLDEGMQSFATVLDDLCGVSVQNIPGAGAAGGMGGAMALFLQAELRSGIDLVLETVGFEGHLSGADLVITGEGKIDAQTMMGKTIQGVLKAAQRQRVNVVAIAGAVEDVEAINNAGVLSVFSITSAPMSLETAMNKAVATTNIKNTVTQIVRLL